MQNCHIFRLVLFSAPTDNDNLSFESERKNPSFLSNFWQPCHKPCLTFCLTVSCCRCFQLIYLEKTKIAGPPQARFFF